MTVLRGECPYCSVESRLICDHCRGTGWINFDYTMPATAGNCATTDISMDTVLRTVREMTELAKRYRRQTKALFERMPQCGCGHKPRYETDPERIVLCECLYRRLKHECLKAAPVPHIAPTVPFNLTGLPVEIV